MTRYGSPPEELGIPVRNNIQKRLGNFPEKIEKYFRNTNVICSKIGILKPDVDFWLFFERASRESFGAGAQFTGRYRPLVKESIRLVKIWLRLVLKTNLT